MLHICSFATSNKLSNSVSKTGKDIAVQMLTGDKPAIHTSAYWDISMDSFSFFLLMIYIPDCRTATQVLLSGSLAHPD